MRCLTLIAVAALAASDVSAQKFDERWVFVMGSLKHESMWPGASNAVVTAAEHGMNGVLWSGGISEVESWPADHLERVERMKRLCAEKNLEIIPTIWPTASAVARYHPELGETSPIEGLRFVRRGAQAEFVSSTRRRLDGLNGDGRVGGEVTSVDVPVRPHAIYRISLKVKTEGFTGASRLSLRAFPKGSWETRAISCEKFKPDQDWTEVVLAAQSVEDDAFSIRMFSSDKKAGGVYHVKDAVLEEIAPAKPSTGLGLKVVSASSGKSYDEGRDFKVRAGRGRSPFSLTIPSGSEIREGEDLLVDVQAPVEVVHASTPLCFTHPGRADYYRRSAAAVKRVLDPKKWFLYCDEIRAGGLCPRCRASGKTMAQLIAEDVKLQCEAIRAVCPDATIYSWSDMFDPNHNAREHYFSMASSLTGIWDLIPKDLVICCWKEGRGEATSAGFFEKLGFRTQVALYYDQDDFLLTRKGLDAAMACPNCRGVVFATWRYNYAKLPEFCKVVDEYDPPDKVFPGLPEPAAKIDLDADPEWKPRFRGILGTSDGTRQPLYWYSPETEKPVPLVVALHTWSASCRWSSPAKTVADWCKERGWAMVYPNFRGPNSRPEACGSDLAVQDIVDAVAWAKRTRAIDGDCVYIIGASGGGHMSLLMAGRHPELFAGAVAFCPISDLARWHGDSIARKNGYARMMEASCGGLPAARSDEYAHRSPLTFLSSARTANLPVYIATGIHDGHSGSVPVGHAIRAYNALADSGDRVSETEIAAIESDEKVPDALAFRGRDPFYPEKMRIHLRRTSANVRLTLFEGGHAGNFRAGLDFLSRQRRGAPADMTLPDDAKGKIASEDVTK